MNSLPPLCAFCGKPDCNCLPDGWLERVKEWALDPNHEHIFSGDGPCIARGCKANCNEVSL